MGREVWGAYSVRDHLEPQLWAADVPLYDRLLVPVPQRLDEPEGSAEWLRWTAKGWEPKRQKELLSILGEAVQPITWDGFLQQQWSDLHGASLSAFTAQVDTEARRPSAANPWLATAMVLQQNDLLGLPVVPGKFSTDLADLC